MRVRDGAGREDRAAGKLFQLKGRIMLLLREEGLDSCPQEAWAVYAPQIREVAAIPEKHIFFCGLSIGYRDPAAPVNAFPVARAPLEESVRWEGWQ